MPIASDEPDIGIEQFKYNALVPPVVKLYSNFPEEGEEIKTELSVWKRLAARLSITPEIDQFEVVTKLSRTTSEAMPNNTAVLPAID
jgi:hypothetical protein